MSSEIRVNKINNRVGLGTVSFTDTGPVVSGIVTASLGLRVPDNVYSYFGTGNDLSIRHDAAGGNHSYIFNTGAGVFKLASDTQMILGETTDRNYIQMNPNSDVKLFFNNSQKLATSNTGVTVTGTAVATSFSGSGENLTNLTASQLIGPLPAISGANLIGIDGSKFGGGATGIQTVSNLGIQTANITAPDLVGAASSLVGLYIGDGSLLFSNNLSRAGGYYITTGVNALNAGPVTLNTKMTLDGTWVIV